MDRPSLFDDHLLKNAAQALMPRLFGIEPCDEVLEDLTAALKKTAPEFDGFAIGEFLKDHRGWSIDGNLVEDLNGAFTEVLHKHENEVHAWVAREHIVPRQALNDPVGLKVKGVQHQGTIVRIDERSATYVVAIAALGHGIKDAWGGCTNGLVIPFEELHTIVTPAEEFELVMQ